MPGREESNCATKDSLRRKFDEKHRDAKVRRLSEMKQQDDLHALERDLMLAFPSFSGLEPPHCQPQSPKAVELGGTPAANRPVPIAVPENLLAKDTFSGRLRFRPQEARSWLGRFLHGNCRQTQKSNLDMYQN